MRRRYCSTLPVLAAALVLAACTQLAPVSPSPENQETVVVPIHLTVAPTETISSFADAPSSFAGLTGESPATKTDYEPEAPGYDADAAIKTLTVMQFEKDETGDGYTRVGNLMTYDYAALENHTENIALKVSARKNIIFVLANAAGLGLDKIPLEGHTTLASFLESQNSSQLGTLDSVWFQPPGGGADRYLRMSAALALDGVTLGTNIGTDGNKLELKRNCAKIVVKVKSSGADPVTLKGVQLCDINKEYHYVTNIPDSFDPIKFTDAYFPQTSRRFDDTEKVFPDDGVVDGEYRTYTWYVPVNERGTIINSVQGNKNRQAPVGATHLCIYAVDGSGNHITYTYYLGENLTNDFNLKPNRKYTYTIDIQGKGDPATDSRVEHMDEIVFASDANSYMLKPPTGAGQTRTYKIPVRRAAVFWNAPGTNMGVYGASTADALVDDLTESTAWEARVVWNEIYTPSDPDNPVANDQILIGASGTGFNPANPGSTPYITVRVGAGMYGNAVIAIKKTGTDDDATLWSWHLWVTDYNPYVEMTPVDGTYIYGVPGGEIHRYVDNGITLWGVGGDYARAFMMDRNLGANAVTGDYISHGMYYQYGRKDPFRPRHSPLAADDFTMRSYSASRGIRYFVHHPNELVIDNYDYWTLPSDDLGNNEKVRTVWKDKKIDEHLSDHCEPGKSIYDPCPYGWQLPFLRAFFDFNFSKGTWSSTLNGYDYCPEGIENRFTKGEVYFPGAGILETRTGYNPGNPNRDLVVAQMYAFDGLYRIGGPADPGGGANKVYFYYDFNGIGNQQHQSLTDVEGSCNPLRCIRIDYRRPY